jgi:hypothetical protein
MKKLICTAVLATASLGAFAQDAAEDLNGPTVVCTGALAGDPRVAVLADKVDVAPMPFAHMARAPNRIATAAERKAIALWVTRRDECFHAGTEYRLKTLLTEEQSYADSLFGAQRALSVQLLQGRMTYAQYNRYRFDLFQSAQYEAGYPAAAAAW